MITRRLFLAAFALLFSFAAVDVHAQSFRPREPLDPAKAQSLPLTPLSIQTAKGKVDFQVELADTDEERRIGMMFRTDAPWDRGMLFDMKQVAPVSFWMRNCFMYLDMIFIGPDGNIKSIAVNAIPHDERGISSKVPILAVLELKGGGAEHHGIQVGDKVTHAMFKK